MGKCRWSITPGDLPKELLPPWSPALPSATLLNLERSHPFRTLCKSLPIWGKRKFGSFRFFRSVPWLRRSPSGISPQPAFKNFRSFPWILSMALRSIRSGWKKLFKMSCAIGTAFRQSFFPFMELLLPGRKRATRIAGIAKRNSTGSEKKYGKFRRTPKSFFLTRAALDMASGWDLSQRMSLRKSLKSKKKCCWSARPLPPRIWRPSMKSMSNCEIYFWPLEARGLHESLA